MYSAMTVTDAQSVDQSAPGAPVFGTAPLQDDKQWGLTVVLPSTDHDNTPLTGLKRLTIVQAVMSAGVNPLSGLTMDEAIALPGSVVTHVPLTDDQAGQTVDVDVNVINMGGLEAFGIAVNDEA